MALKTQPDQDWSIREKLCLASAVMRSGDQNWMSVSRAIKPFPEPGRLPDWNTARNCAIEYSKMLNDVDTPKRKRSGDRGDIVETPGDLIVKKLTFDRIEELKAMIADDRKKFKLLRDQIELIESGQLDEKLPEMILDIEAKKRAAEAAKVAAEAEAEAASRAAAALAARRKSMPQRRPSIDIAQTEPSVPAKPKPETTDEKKPAEITPASTAATTAIVTTTVTKQDASSQQQAVPTTPTPNLLSTLLGQKVEERKKEPVPEETLLEVKSILEGTSESKSSTKDKDTSVPVIETESKTEKENLKETPTLSKLLVSKQEGYQGSTPVLRVEESSKDTEVKQVETKDENEGTETDAKMEEEEISVTEDSTTKSQLLIPKPMIDNDDSSDVSVAVSTAPSSPAAPSVKSDDGKSKKKKVPTATLR